MQTAKSWQFLSSQNRAMTSPGEPPTLGAGQTLCTRIRGWFFSFMMLFSALFGAIYIITPLVPLLFWNPRLWRKIMDRLVGLWVVMPGALMTFLFGSKVSIKGDLIEHSEPALIIMNHRSRLDWLFFWNALYKMDPWLCTSEKISMKGILKYVPGAGWAMGSNAFIFLDRSFESDATKLDSMLSYYASVGYSYQLLLFPEGTDKCPKATERSRAFAEKNSLTHYDYVLHPRVTGFVHIVQTMRKTNYIKYIYDVTIGFGDSIVQSEVDLVVHGVCPTDVQYQVVKIPIDSLPKDDEGLALWIKDLWAKKELKLKEFYSKVGDARKFPDPPGRENSEFKMTEQAKHMQFFIVFLWFFTTFFWMCAFFELSFMMVFALFSVIMFTLIQKYYGGIEWLTVREFNRSRAALTDPVPRDPVNGHLPVSATDSE